MIDYANYLGKPFAWKGRGPGAYDCWGLTRALLLNMGQDVPDWPSEDDGTVNQATVLLAIAGGWEPTSAEVGSVALFRLPYGPHVGVVIGPDRFAHVTKSTAVCIERLSDALWRSRIVGFYRWKGSNA